jgi:hypothetical protein
MRLLLAATLAAILCATAASAGDPDGFGMWTVADFQAHEKALDQKVHADHSARETLGA